MSGKEVVIMFLHISAQLFPKASPRRHMTIPSSKTTTLGGRSEGSKVKWTGMRVPFITGLPDTISSPPLMRS